MKMIEEGKMTNHNIEVDSDVWSFLKEHAEPFEDTPNSVLRRLLFKENKVAQQPTEHFEIPPSIPEALAQTLQVVYEVRHNGFRRSPATNIVARRRGIAPQSVLDKYCRQLGKRAPEIDDLLQQRDLSKLSELLTKRFPEFKDFIFKYLKSLI